MFTILLVFFFFVFVFVFNFYGFKIGVFKFPGFERTGLFDIKKNLLKNYNLYVWVLNSIHLYMKFGVPSKAFASTTPKIISVCHSCFQILDKVHYLLQIEFDQQINIYLVGRLFLTDKEDKINLREEHLLTSDFIYWGLNVIYFLLNIRVITLKVCIFLSFVFLTSHN